MKTKLKDRRALRHITSRCLLDHLESRVLLDGNITASVSGGMLSLQGDDLNNSIIIDQIGLGSGQFRVSSGDAATTINGSLDPQIFSDVSGLTINAGAGNDTLTIQGAAVANDIQVNGAGGNQIIDLYKLTVGGDFSLTNSGGQNSTTLEETTIGGSVAISAGIGFNSQTGTLWGGSAFADANQIFTLSDNSSVNNGVSIANGSEETTTDIENSTINTEDPTITTDLLVVNGSASYGSLGFNSALSSSPAGDLFILTADSTVGNNVSVTNASSGNATIIEGSSSIGGDLAVANTSAQSAFSTSCCFSIAGDTFTLTDFASVDGNVTVSNVSNGASTLIENFGYIGGTLTVTNTAADIGQCCCTTNYGQTSPGFGDYLSLTGGSTVIGDVSIINGSSYDSTDIDSSFVGGDLSVTNGFNLAASVYTTDLLTLNAGYVFGSVSISNGAGDINTSIGGDSFISGSLSITNPNGTNFSNLTLNSADFQDAQSTATVPAVPQPQLTITKTASASSVQPGASITYTYVVTNPSDMPAMNVVVTDDDGIPNNPDPTLVGTIDCLPAGASQTLTLTLTAPAAPPLGTPTILTEVINGQTVTIGTLTTTLLTSGSFAGDYQVVFNQSLGIVDNTYGANTSSGWGNQSHSFNDLLGSDQAEFQFFAAGNSTPVLDFISDYVSQASSATFNGNTVTYPSGYGTLGFSGGDGQFISGNSAYVLNIDTTITDDLNQSSDYYGFTTNSPSPTSTLDANWNNVDGYTIIVSPKAFDSGGFGGVAVTLVHDSPAKLQSTIKFIPSVGSYPLTNTATVAGTECGQLVTASTSAPSAHSVASTATSGGQGSGPGPGPAVPPPPPAPTPPAPPAPTPPTPPAPTPPPPPAPTPPPPPAPTPPPPPAPTPPAPPAPTPPAPPAPTPPAPPAPTPPAPPAPTPPAPPAPTPPPPPAPTPPPPPAPTPPPPPASKP